MTKAELEAIVAEQGLNITGLRQGAGKFRDVEIGLGATIAKLQNLAIALKNHKGLTVSFQTVTNKEHPDYGKQYVELSSFWWE